MSNEAEGSARPPIPPTPPAKLDQADVLAWATESGTLFWMLRCKGKSVREACELAGILYDARMDPDSETPTTA